MTVIALGGTAPAQTTVTAPGSYNVTIALLTTNPQVNFQGPGTFTLTSVAGLLSGYTIEATNGANVVISGLASAANTANLVVSDASTITLSTGVSALSTLNTSFIGTGGGTLAFAPGLLAILNTAPSVAGFGASDHIDFGSAFVAGEQVQFTANGTGSGGTLSLTSSTGAVLGTVRLVGAYTQSSFAVGQATNGDAVINFACFLKNTMILTDTGEVRVELLQVGDRVVTASGAISPIMAVRLRSFPEDSTVDRSFVQPIRIRAGALSDNVPSRDLFVSPDHSMYLDEVLVPAQLLVNGSTIAQVAQAGTIDYYHIELAPHDIIIAEGAETESYLDIGNRNHFGKANMIGVLDMEEPKTWEDACAPLILGGTELEQIRERISNRRMLLAQNTYMSNVA